MVEINAIKEKYASMPDSELVSFAKNESRHLTDEGLALLKAELIRRKITDDIDTEPFFPPERNADDPFIESQLLYVLEQKELGKNNAEIIVSLKEYGLDDQRVPEVMMKAESVAIQKLKKAETEWLVGSVFLVSGIAITFLPLSMPANRLTYIIAWCAILFGALKSIQGIYNKSRFKNIIRNLTKEENDRPDKIRNV